MKYICLKNWHWFLPVFPRIYWNKRFFYWSAELNESCRYFMSKDAMKSWHKLVGVSNHLNPRKESIRFVWKWDLELQKFRVAVFIERNREFKKTVYELAVVEPGERFYMTLYFKQDQVTVNLNDNKSTLPFQIKKLAFRLNPYFGGQKKAPHCMSLNLKS